MIELFEHNRIAYESAAAMLRETGKAAVIHPTGTGKSFIGFKLCEDHPDGTVCWLSPSEYIFTTQLENLKAAGFDVPGNIRFCTYAKLMNISEAEIQALRPAYIILDEFHRVSANLKMSFFAGIGCRFMAVSMRWVCSLDYPLLVGLKPVKS